MLHTSKYDDNVEVPKGQENSNSGKKLRLHVLSTEPQISD